MRPLNRHPAIRIVLVLLVIVVAGLVWLGYSTVRAGRDISVQSPGTVGTSGALDSERAREAGAQIAEKAASATAKVHETVAEAALTTKIKAKMALDDSVRARSIDVSTTGSTVTLTGTVRSQAAHDRAIALARETAGITHVVDHLVVQPWQ